MKAKRNLSNVAIVLVSSKKSAPFFSEHMGLNKGIGRHLLAIVNLRFLPEGLFKLGVDVAQ